MEENEEIDLGEAKRNISDVYKKLDVKDLVIILLILLLFFMYIVHQRDIQACNSFFNDMLKNRF